MEEAVEPASIWRRALAYFIDFVIVSVLVGQCLVWTGQDESSKTFRGETNTSFGFNLMAGVSKPVSLVMYTEKCGAASPDFADLLALSPGQKVEDATTCVSRDFGMLSSAVVNYVISTDGGPTISQRVILESTSEWVKNSKHLQMAALILVSAGLIWRWCQTPGKFILKIGISNASPKGAVVREAIKNAPHYPYLVLTAGSELGILPDWGKLSDFNTVEVLCLGTYLVLAISLWLYPLRKSSTGTLWDRLAKTQVVQQKLQESQPSA